MALPTVTAFTVQGMILMRLFVVQVIVGQSGSSYLGVEEAT